MLRTFFIYIQLYFIKVLLLFGYKKSTKPIPNGTVYCYEPDIEKNKNKEETDYSYYIKPCKYYVRVNKYKTACKFTGFIGEDLLHNDQCKICGIKEH